MNDAGAMNLDLDTAQALRDLAKVLTKVEGQMQQSDSRLIKSLEAVWGSLGVHTNDILAVTNIAAAAEKTVRESAEALANMMIRTAEKIEQYVFTLPGGGVSTAPAAGSNGGEISQEHYTKRISKEDTNTFWESAVESIDQQIENYREALKARGVPDCPWLEETLAQHRTKMVQYESQQLELARGGNSDASVQYKYPRDYKVFYDGLARDFQKHCLKGTNPNYGSGSEWATNCQRCVPAYEMRRRGMEVSAKPYAPDDRHLISHPYDVWQNPQVLRTEGNGLEDIRRAMSGWGDGARAQIVVIWNDGFGVRGHTFVAEQRGRKTLFFDPQSGKSDAQLHFARVVPGRTTFCRIDNLKPSGYMTDCCKKEKSV